MLGLRDFSHILGIQRVARVRFKDRVRTPNIQGFIIIFRIQIAIKCGTKTTWTIPWPNDRKTAICSSSVRRNARPNLVNFGDLHKAFANQKDTGALKTCKKDKTLLHPLYNGNTIYFLLQPQTIIPLNGRKLSDYHYWDCGIIGFHCDHSIIILLDMEYGVSYHYY